MAHPGRPFAFQQADQQSSAIDAKRTGAAVYTFDDDDSSSSILDPSILDSDIMQSPNALRYRKASLANSNGVLSPADSHAWETQYGPGLSAEPASTGAAQHYHDEYTSNPGAHAQSFHHPSHQNMPGNPWSMVQASGERTPTSNADMMPPPLPFDTMHYARSRPDAAHSHPAHYSSPTHPDSSFIPAPQVQTPMSPQSHQEWMAMAQQELEARPISKRMRPNTSPRPIADMPRRDGGIQKKNKRIDIPHERNIQTIDQMIESTKDEDLLKELKAQKRLLRNREAALASRQRKKKHTEDLETKEKDYQTQINHLEHELESWRAERDTLNRDRQILIHRTQEAERLIEVVQMEKRDLLMKHTEETASLRKKVQILTEQLEAAPAMSAAPSSTGFTDFNAEMEALSMGNPHEWEPFVFLDNLHRDTPTDDFCFDSSEVLEKKPAVNAMAVIPSSNKPATDNNTDQPIASGLLFMLLMFGAFVASKSATTTAVDLPVMPAEVRAAAPTVLNNLLSEPGAASASQHIRSAVNTAPEPGASLSANVHSRNGNRMEQMHKRLTAPTRQQEIDSAFALTPSQYASLTNSDFTTYDQNVSPPQPRRTLAEALGDYQPSNNANKAQVYTRSLLWEQIPADVVKQFKDMVRDHNELEQRDQQRQSHDPYTNYDTET